MQFLEGVLPFFHCLHSSPVWAAKERERCKPCHFLFARCDKQTFRWLELQLCDTEGGRHEKNGAECPNGERGLFLPAGIERHFPNTNEPITNTMLLCNSHKIVLFEYQGHNLS